MCGKPDFLADLTEPQVLGESYALF